MPHTEEDLEGLEQFSFTHEGELLTGYVTQYETETVDVYVQSTGKYYEVPVKDQMSLRGCKLREFGDLPGRLVAEA